MPVQHEEVVGSIPGRDQNTTSVLPVIIKEEVLEREDFLEEHLVPSVNQGGDSPTSHARFGPLSVSISENNGTEYINMFASVKQYGTTHFTERTLCTSSNNVIEDGLLSSFAVSDENVIHNVSFSKSAHVKGNRTQNAQRGGITEVDSKSVNATTSGGPDSVLDTFDADSNGLTTGIDNTSNDYSHNDIPGLHFNTDAAISSTSRSTADVDVVADKCKGQVTNENNLSDSSNAEKMRHSGHNHSTTVNNGGNKPGGTSGGLMTAVSRSSSSDVKLPDPKGCLSVTPTKRKIVPSFTKRMSGKI